MFIILPLLLAWVTSAIGWGGLTVSLLRRFGLRSPYGYDPLEPVIGLVLLTTLTNLINFVSPISNDISLELLVLGWVFFLWTARRFTGLLGKPLWLLGGLAWLCAISTEAVLRAWNGDSGFYHVPSMHWLADSITPAGLANLNGRFGFNSSWFSLSTLMAQLVAPHTQAYSAIASETLLALFGLAVAYALYRLLRDGTLALPDLFLLVSGIVGFAPVLLDNISSPSTDHPPLLLSLLLIYVMLRAISNRFSDPVYDFWLACLLVFYIVTLKASLLPIILLPVFVGFLVLQERVHLDLRRLALGILGAGILVGLPWVIRGLMASGCLLYPVSATCIWRLPWTVTRAQADTEASWIASWARNPHHSPQLVLANWDWLVPWSARSLPSYDFLIPVGCLILGILLLVLMRSRLKALEAPRYLAAIFLTMFIGLVYWFLSAPELRFGVSWFWASGILALSMGLSRATAFRQGFVLQLPAVLLVAAALLSVANVGISYIQRAGWPYQSLYLAVPFYPEEQYTSRKTTQGVTVYMPADGGAWCWWETLPCTPYFDASITMGRGKDYRLFVYPGR